MFENCIIRRLEQQTPIVHFQHDQKGAMLRATEVKPKFDKLIIDKVLERKRQGM